MEDRVLQRRIRERGRREFFCRIEGSEGAITIEGLAASQPTCVTIRKHTGEEKICNFEKVGKGIYWEADAATLDTAADRTESPIIPWAETIRIMEMLDEARSRGGARFPQDLN